MPMTAPTPVHRRKPSWWVFSLPTSPFQISIHSENQKQTPPANRITHVLSFTARGPEGSVAHGVLPANCISASCLPVARTLLPAHAEISPLSVGPGQFMRQGQHTDWVLRPPSLRTGTPRVRADAVRSPRQGSHRRSAAARPARCPLVKTLRNLMQANQIAACFRECSDCIEN